VEETRARAVVKALTYRIWQSLNTLIITLLITKELKVATAIVSIEIVVKIVVYFMHERIWNLFNWGRTRV
jgi:uncharacterized membrane protein